MVVVIATTSIPSEMNSTLKGAVLARKKELDLEQLWHEWFWLKIKDILSAWYVDCNFYKHK